MAIDMKVIAIGYHPDDYEVGAAMRLICHVEMKDSVVGIICSDGEKGGDRKTRIKEAEKAAKFLGLEDLHLLHFPDVYHPDIATMKDSLEEIISRENPSFVYTHFSDDRHQDHEVTSRATMIACRKVPTILFYRTPSTNISFQPNLFHIGSEEDFLKKLKLIEIYQSQLKRDNGINLELIKTYSKFYGYSIDCYSHRPIYAEPFCANRFILNSKNLDPDKRV